MTALAQLLLVLTSLAPVGLVYAGVLADSSTWVPAGILTVAALLLTLLCPWLLRRTENVVPAEPREVRDLSSKEGEPLTFLVAYALPILAVDRPTEPLCWGLMIFIVVVAATVWQQQVFHLSHPLIFGAPQEAQT